MTEIEILEFRSGLKGHVSHYCSDINDIPVDHHTVLVLMPNAMFSGLLSAISTIGVDALVHSLQAIADGRFACCNHARLVIHAEEMYEALKAAEKTSKAKKHCTQLAHENLGTMEAIGNYTDALGDSHRMRKEILAKMEEKCTKQ